MSDSVVTVDFRVERPSAMSVPTGATSAGVVAVTRFKLRDPLTQSFMRVLRAREALVADLAAADAGIADARARLKASIAAADRVLARSVREEG